MIEVLAFLAVGLLAATGFLAWRLSQGPVDLELLRPHVERSLTEARGGQPVSIDTLALEWAPGRSGVEVAGRGVSAMDAAGALVSRAERAAITLDALALLGGKLKVQRLRLEDGAASVRRSRDGVWTLVGIEVFSEPRPSGDLLELIRDLNWTTLATPIRALAAGGTFERVELVDFTLDVTDEGAGSTWSANPVNGVWSAGEDGVALVLDLKLVGAAEPNRIGLSLSANGAVNEATGQLTLQGVDPVSIARMFGYAGDGFASGTPANASFTIKASETGGLQSTRLTLSDVTGRARINGRDVSVGGLSLDATYDPAVKRIDLTSLEMASDLVSGAFTGSADVTRLMAGDAAGAIPFTLAGTRFEIDATPVFAEAWPFQSAAIEATFHPAASRLEIASLTAQTGDLRAKASGEIWLAPALVEAEGDDASETPSANAPPRKLGLKLTALGEGAATPQQVVAFWPVNLGSGGRNWVINNVLAGKTTRADLKLDWPPGANSVGYLTDQHLSLEFDVTDATVSFLKDFPPVTGVAGKGYLRGNSLTMDVTAGRMGGWQAEEGKVVLPRFYPKGGMLDVTVDARGELRELMRVLDASDLAVGSKYGLAVDEMGGAGGIAVHIQRPMLDIVPDDALKFDITGGFRNASVPNLIAGFGLSSSDVRVDVTQDGMSITGAGQFGPAPVVFDWKERFGEGGGSDLTASAKATPDLLNAFGLAARNFMQGEAGVELRASGPGGRDFSEITANVDLTRAQLEIPLVGWRKRYDSVARGSFRYGKDSEGAIMTGDIRADGLELIGEARMDAGNQLQSAAIERIFSRDSIDLRGGVARRADGGYRLTLAGPYFDASPWMDGLLTMGDGAAAEEPEAPDASQGGPASPTFDISLSTDRMKLREGEELTAAKIALKLDGGGAQSGDITGQITPDQGVAVTIRQAEGGRRVTIRSDDAGFAARVLLKLDYLFGGKLALDGTFGDAGGEAQVTLTDVRLREAPLVAQLLSLASLRGLADVLGGEGVLFTRVDAPIRLKDGRLDLPGLRASGPAMGLTARGWIAMNAGELSLDGVLVPSFGVNSVLGGIPVIGDLFVSRQGEGMFAPTYSVRGTFERARVSINPVAALTPGVLRRIFENPGEAPPAPDAPAPADGPVAPPPPAN